VGYACSYVKDRIKSKRQSLRPVHRATGALLATLDTQGKTAQAQAFLDSHYIPTMNRRKRPI
jgi:hypothetical protein